jgi:hypothetical protein
MRLIGLNGRLHSGKDTAVEFIRGAALGEEVQRIGFADKLKLSAARALGFDGTVEQAVAFCNHLKENFEIRLVDQRTSKLNAPYRRVSGREYLQWYGTEAHRQVFDDQFWVNALLPQRLGDKSTFGEQEWMEADTRRANRKALEYCFPNADVVVVTDVRFPNEAARIIELGGEVWHIDATDRLGPLPEDAHVSEHPLAGELITKVVSNNDDHDAFEHAIRNAFYYFQD